MLVEQDFLAGDPVDRIPVDADLFELGDLVVVLEALLEAVLERLILRCIDLRQIEWGLYRGENSGRFYVLRRKFLAVSTIETQKVSR